MGSIGGHWNLHHRVTLVAFAILLSKSLIHCSQNRSPIASGFPQQHEERIESVDVSIISLTSTKQNIAVYRFLQRCRDDCYVARSCSRLEAIVTSSKDATSSIPSSVRSLSSQPCPLLGS